MIHHPAAPTNPASRSGSVLRVVIALFAVIAIAGCGSTNSKYDKTANWSAEQLYADAKADDRLDEGIDPPWMTQDRPRASVAT